MGRVKTIARRTFLIGSAAIVGGVAFGVYSVKKSIPNPNLENLPDDSISFNPWVVIDGEKITLITPHADKGQGVVSMQAMLLAEELDLEPGQFETSFGMPSAAYWNQGMAAAIAESAGLPIGFIFKLMGMQITGGSSAVPDSFVKLREAGASARETLKLAASKKTGVDVAKLTTKAGQVILPDGTAISYTDLAASVADIDPVTDVALRDPSQWRRLGKPMQRIDILAKSTGTQDYGIDIVKPDMVYVACRTNPRKGGESNSFDASIAMNMRGVSNIVPVTGGAAVVADNSWRAIQAVNAIEFDWGSAPYPAEQSEHWAALGNSFNADLLNAEERNDGDIETALSEGDMIEAEYRSPYVAHAPLEPLNATVVVTDERVDIWAGHQIPRQVEVLAAAITGHDVENVHFHNQFIGGSFGHRLEFDQILRAAEVANQMRGTTIKLTYSREEDFAHDYPRHITLGRMKGSVKDQQVHGFDFEIAGASVMYSTGIRSGMGVPGPDPAISEGGWDTPLSIPNVRARSYANKDLAPVSFWRAVGSNGAGFMWNGFFDELAHKAGADPLQERMRLTEDDVARKVLEEVATMSDWGNVPAGRARGVAMVQSFGVPCAQVAEISQQDGAIKLENVWVACDVGTILDPVNFENLVQGGVVFGLGHAMNSEITYSDGMAQQENYYDAEGMRLFQMPKIHVKGLQNGAKIRGIGEPPVPVAAPALANAIFALTGKRLREMPFNKFVDFV